MAKPDGGPAFPRSAARFDAENPPTNGMSLRDYFAGQALAAMLPEVQVKDWDGQDALIVEHVGSLAYEIADAMIAEREK